MPDEDFPSCPQCGGAVDMSDSDVYCLHTTYWADDEPKPHICRKCGLDFYIAEHVTRWWTSGRTPEEAAGRGWSVLTDVQEGRTDA